MTDGEKAGLVILVILGLGLWRMKSSAAPAGGSPTRPRAKPRPAQPASPASDDDDGSQTDPSRAPDVVGPNDNGGINYDPFCDPFAGMSYDAASFYGEVTNSTGGNSCSDF